MLGPQMSVHPKHKQRVQKNSLRGHLGSTLDAIFTIQSLTCIICVIISREGLTTYFYLAKIQAQGTLPKRLNLRCVILKNHSQYYYSLLQPNTTSIFIFRILTPNVHKAYWHVKQPAGLYHEYFNTKTTIAWIIIFAPKRWCRIYGFLNQTFYIFNFYWIC